MCFSATADVVVGVVITGIGVDAMQNVRRPAERLLAALPLVLGAHQLVEAFVWSGLESGDEAVWRPAAWIYLAIAFGVVPVLVPIAVGALEPVTSRRRTLLFSTLGAVVAAILMVAVVRGPMTALIDGHHIAYTVDLWHGGVIVALYVVATCGSLLASERPHVRWFGAVNLVAVVGLAWLDQMAFISLWCAWAAVTSAAIAVHLRADREDSEVPISGGIEA